MATGADADTPLSAVMTAPARTVAADRSGGEALMEMLDHGVRHLPVLDAQRRLLGVVDDVDLIASERRAPFRIRARIAASESAVEVADAARELSRTVVALHDARVAATTISRMIASIHDTATRRLIELAERELGRPPVPYAWLALGSFGRREPYPGSDADSALAWDGPGRRRAARHAARAGRARDRRPLGRRHPSLPGRRARLQPGVRPLDRRVGAGGRGRGWPSPTTIAA